MTRTESARLVGHNYRHLGVTFGKPWERIDRCGPGEYVGKHQAAPDCRCVEAGQPIFEGVGVYHLHDCAWLRDFATTGGCMGGDA